MTTLILVLADQLTPGLASLRDLDPADAVVLMAEVREECTYVRHHKKKIAFLFSAMRHFAGELRAAGWTVDYVTLDAPGNTQSFDGELHRALARHRPTQVRVVESGEHRVDAMMQAWRDMLPVPVDVLTDDRFLVSRAEFGRWAGTRKQLTMEYFYRDCRRKTGLLMEADGKPAGGAWNYDKENRKRPPRGLNYPAPPRWEPDAITQDCIALVAREFGEHFGDLTPFGFGVTRAHALEALDFFVANSLPRFGDYQDAMVTGQDYLYHAALSPYMNSGLLTAREVCAAADAAYRAGEVPLNAAEGFIRQIIGWREYIRGIYFHAGPDYVYSNELGATRPLPGFYWTGGSGMFCIDQSVDQTRREAYAHHIQRLMVLGNFAMLAGIDPKQVSDWYLVVYADAYEWAEVPNVVGMSQFADGGILGSKPYAGSGAYINRMSDYCPRCKYDVDAKTGPKACPFNYLYWDFLARHEDKFASNMRIGRAYDTWGRFGPERQAAVRDSAAAFLGALEAPDGRWAL